MMLEEVVIVLIIILVEVYASYKLGYASGEYKGVLKYIEKEVKK